MLRKVPAENGVPRKVPKKCFGVRSPVLVSTEERTPKHFFGTFLGTLFSAGTFRSTLFGTFPGRGFGTSLDSGKKKTNKHKHFRRDGVRDKQEPSLGQMGPLPGTNWDPSLGQTGLSLFNSTVKSPFCPVCPWDRWGFVPGTLSHKGRQKNVYVFSVYWFFLLPISGVAPANQTKERSVHELFAGAFRNKSSM